jgi:hypothetical protein
MFHFATSAATIGLLAALMPISIVLAAPPSVSLEQCRNGSAASPNDCPAPGGGSGWVSGNVGASQGHLLEGYSIPYRAVMTDLPLNQTITLVLGYDIKHSGLHALDYLTHYDRLLPHGVFGHGPESINPVGDIAGLSIDDEVNYAIPAPSSQSSPVDGQPNTSFLALPDAEREMALFGGTFQEVVPPAGGVATAIYYVSQGSLTASQAETTIAVSFKATQSTVVLAWGGHIARGDEWNGLSASAISGSPYHMRTKSWNLNNVGNQDRSLSAGAVVNPPKLIVIKTVVNDNGGNNVASDFQINVRDGSNQPIGDPSDFAGAESPGTQVLFPDTATYTVNEDAFAGYAATYSADCFNGSTGTISVDQTKTCTITNNDVAPTLALNKTVSSPYGGNAVENDFVLSATPTTGTTITDAGGDVPATTAQSNMVYTLSETTVSGYTEGTWSCTGTGLKAFDATAKTVELDSGAAVTCAITNTEVAPTLALDKTVIDNAGGGAVENDFVLSATPTTGTTITDAGGDVPATTAQSNMVYTLSETTVSGYTGSAWGCTGTGIKNFDATAGTLELNEGAAVTCSITNTDSKASPSGTTVQHWVLHDTLAISGIRPGAPDAGEATVTFRLFSDASCSVQVGEDEVDESITSEGVASTTAGITVLDTGEYRWRATYSGDDYNNGFTTACGSEITQIFAKDALPVGEPSAPRDNIIVPFPS